MESKHSIVLVTYGNKEILNIPPAPVRSPRARGSEVHVGERLLRAGGVGPAGRHLRWVGAVLPQHGQSVRPLGLIHPLILESLIHFSTPPPPKKVYL